MDGLFSIKELALEFGIDRSGLLRKIKKKQYRIFKRRDTNGQLYYLISEQDANSLRRERYDTIQPSDSNSTIKEVTSRLEDMHVGLGSLIKKLKEL